MGVQATETSLRVALMMVHMVLLQVDLCRNWCWEVG